MGGGGRDRPHCPPALPVRRYAAVFHLPWDREWDRLRTAGCQAVRAGALLPLSPLLPAGAREPERGRLGPPASASQQNTAAPWRRTRHVRAVPQEAEGHVASHL